MGVSATGVTCHTAVIAGFGGVFRLGFKRGVQNLVSVHAQVTSSGHDGIIIRDLLGWTDVPCIHIGARPGVLDAEGAVSSGVRVEGSDSAP